MGNYGMKIAKAGKDITSATLADYHFWSKYRAKSIKYQGSLQVTTNSGASPVAVTNTYTHNFGYIPQFMVFVTSYDGGYVNCNYSTGGLYSKGPPLEQWDEILTAYATSTTLVVSALLYYYVPGSGSNTGIARTYTFDILLFMEEVETS